MSWRSVALFRDTTAAEPVRLWLEKAGFSARVNADPPFKTVWRAKADSGGVRLEVPMDIFEKAEQALLADPQGNVLCHAIRCPECGSLRVAFPQYARHSLLPNLTLGLAARLGLIRREYFCENCQYTWRRGLQRTPGEPRTSQAP